jgi:anthranilate synthase/aminodeoxychorismate synthase-like glutamine amidotransferase
MKVLLIDNYDSFTYNLAHLFGELGAEVVVRRNDEITVTEAEALEPTHVVISPGPGRPEAAGVSEEIVRTFAGRVPTLGVCLGHQSLAQAFGGAVVRHHPVHGKTAAIEHDGRTIFAGLPSPLTVGRYHSLVVDSQLPACFEQSASGAGVVMAIRHRELPAEGVQFHPESVLTEAGKQLLSNFLAGGHAGNGA